MQLSNSFKNIWELLLNTAKDFSDDKAFQHAAALSFYTVLSLPPIIIIVVNIAGKIMGEGTIETELYNQIGWLIGEKATTDLQKILQTVYVPEKSTLATIIGIGTLLFTATAVFYSLQTSINQIWNVKPKPMKRGWWLKLIFDRMMSFAMVLSIGFIMLVSLIFNAVIKAISNRISELNPDISSFLLYSYNLIIPFVIVTLFFAMIFKVLPDARIRWRDVWIGSLFTSVMFSIGKFAIGIYLGNSQVANAYGAAGSIIILLLWVFYSSHLIFFGAEFTYNYTRLYGRQIKPNRYSVKVIQQEVELDGKTPVNEENEKDVQIHMANAAKEKNKHISKDKDTL